MIDTLLQSLVDVTDPASLHAELWADSVLKVVSCWLPVLMSTVLVGRDLLGSSTKCFPLHLVHGTVQPENVTFVSDGNSTDNPFSGIPVYTRQLSEFVNVYCVGTNSFSANPKFSYSQFALMLVIQAALMYTPFLVWNVTIGREVICNIRFIAYDMVVLYDRFRQKDADETKKNTVNEQENAPADGQGQNIEQAIDKEPKSPYKQEELVEAVKKWRKSRAVYICYLVKQALSFSIAIAFIVAYPSHQPISVTSIEDKFQCSVESKFSVTCTVPAAPVHRYVWWTNVVLLAVNVILTLIHIITLHVRAKDQPFAEVGIEVRKDQTEQEEEQGQEGGQEGLHEGGQEGGQERGQEGGQERGQEIGQEGGQEREQDGGQGGGRADPQPVKDDDNDEDAQSRPIIIPHVDDEANQVSKHRLKFWPALKSLNDSHMMHAFFKANIESVEKYNYVKSLLKVAPELG
uniref:Uncharacterized protein n=1 Tax=Branchiostoma floridae TaxID=7739 RepID=C3Z0H8_BRAFL|eukprot:XP_002598014.1 hypothetical protein BRAFLDRAFT_79760 [Branchiostoma floridae]